MTATSGGLPEGLAEGLFGGGAKAAAEEITVAVVESTTSQAAQAALRTGGVIERVSDLIRASPSFR
jgi:hypothetical protein